MKLINDFRNVCESFTAPFSTQDMIDKLKSDHPDVWQSEFLSRHVEGGRGCGKYFSASSLVSKQIPRYGFRRVKRWGDSNSIARNWGSGYIAMWERSV